MATSDSADTSSLASTPTGNKNNVDDAFRTKTPKKVTVSLALDAFIVEQIKKQSATLQQSFNARINVILEKYVNYYQMIELNGGATIHPITHQFFIDEIDEAKYVEHLKRLGVDIVASVFAQKGTPITLDKIIQIVYENISMNSGSITSVRKFTDEKDGKTCLYFLHDYDEKWSRILSAAMAYQIQKLLHYHTITETFSKGFQIKILELNPV